MAAGDARRTLWLLREPHGELPTVQRGRPRLAIALSFLAFAALAPAFVFAAPESRWEPQDLFAILLTMGFVSYSAAFSLRTPGRGPVTLDAGCVAALLALVFLGPLPAAAVFAAPELERWLTGSRISRVAASAASIGWAVLAAAFFLQATGREPGDALGGADLVVIAIAGVILIGINYFGGMLLLDVVPNGTSPQALVKYELLPTAPADLGLIATGDATAFTYDEFGIAGLAPLAVVILLPRWIAARTAKRAPVSMLPRWQATSLYARAIADDLRLDKSAKRVLSDAATHLGGPATLTRVDEFHAVMTCVMNRHARWDGEGEWRGERAGEEIPLTSRILTVADSWSALTAEGTHELDPSAALAELKTRAGSDLDPQVVAAAVRVIEAGTL